MPEESPALPASPSSHLIAYLDLLGFRDVLAQAGATFQQIILAALREVAEQERNFAIEVEQKSDSVRSITIHPAITSFSDNVVISYELEGMNQASAFLGLMGIRNMASAFAHRAREFGCLVRGAVTIGELYHKDRVVFGSGLVEAYALENTVAFYPRIIVSARILELSPGIAAADGKSTDDRSMFRDSDGYWCLDYMTAYLEYLGTAITPEACTTRRTWALGTRAKVRETAAALDRAGKHQAAQKWSWFADRFEKSMLSVQPYRFDPNGHRLEFP